MKHVLPKLFRPRSPAGTPSAGAASRPAFTCDKRPPPSQITECAAMSKPQHLREAGASPETQDLLR
jgi:hypothetical protein